MQTTAQAWLVLKHRLAAGARYRDDAAVPSDHSITLFGGALADRVPKRRMLMITQTLAMLQAFVLGMLVLTDTVQLWHVYLLAACLAPSTPSMARCASPSAWSSWAVTSW